MVSHSQLYAEHPASADDLAIFTDGPHCIDRVFEANPEAIGNLRVWIWVCCLAKLLEVFNSDAVFIWRITKNNNVEGLRRGVWRILRRSRWSQRIEVCDLQKLSDRGPGMKVTVLTERWRYAGLSVYVAFKISLTDAVGGASSSEVCLCLAIKISGMLKRKAIYSP